MKDTILSIIRHAGTLLGGYLLAKGYIAESISLWLPGALVALAFGVWGAYDERKATGSWLHFWLSIARHTLTAVGGYFATLGKISFEQVETIIGVIMALAGSIWGTVDEATYAAEHPDSAK